MTNSNLDLDYIQLIREKDLKYLSNSYLIEKDLMPQLGINDELNQEIGYFPEELNECNKNGLKIWQYPIQFSKYLVYLSKLNISSYLEIGVRWGGSFILTVEYLNKFHPLIKAVAIDINDCPAITEYSKINPRLQFKKLNSTSIEFKKFINSGVEFDLAFIDGDHSEEGCWNDFLLMKNRSNLIVFHDIYNDWCMGVVNVWKRLKKEYSEHYYFIEFIDQYNSITKQGKKFMGIGLIIKKNRFKND